MIVAKRPWLSHRAAASAALVSVVAACGGDGPTAVQTDEPETPAAVTGSCVVQPLSAGQSVVLAQGQNCVDLTTPGSRYLVGVINTARAVGSIAPWELGGSRADAGVQGVSPAPAVAPVTVDPDGWLGDVARGPLAAEDAGKRRRARAHERVLEISRGARGLGKPGRQAIAASPTSSSLSLDQGVSAAPAAALQTVGDTATFRIPDINSGSACRTFFSVKTRVVASSQHTLIVEDVTAPLAGQMDATYQGIADEFEQLMWPILTANFGDPLKMDGQLDRNGRIVMLFSPTVNEKFADVAGFVIGCDFYSRQSAPSSNEGEVFYAVVPKSLTGPLTSNDSRDGWLRTMRSTIIHEAKHITSYAERIARGAPPEDGWLEEGTARVSEELYARALAGASWKGNTGYAPLSCEVRPTTAGCTDRPYVMYKHFDGLYSYMAANGSRSPLGKADTDDFTYYASAWSLARWAADHAPSEGTFFQALTRGPAVGAANLEAVAGRPWGEMLADWTMALALDDYPGFTPGRAQRIATWNMREVFAGMNRDFSQYYPRPYPSAPQTVAFGSFAVQSSSLRGGSGSLVELSGTFAGPQRLELRLPGGGAPSSTLRMVVTRLQ